MSWEVLWQEVIKKYGKGKQLPVDGYLFNYKLPSNILHPIRNIITEAPVIKFLIG